MGEIELVEQLSYCKTHKYSNIQTKEIIKYDSDLATDIVEKNFKVTYDLLVKIGLWRYENNLQLEEIKARLEYGPSSISLPISTISLISKRFLEYCKLLHEKYETKIKVEIESNGGYYLHFDGTTEVKSGKLNFVLMDSLSGHILFSKMIDSEKYGDIIDPIKKVKEKYGDPLISLSDLRTGFLDVCLDVFKGKVRHIYCHYHFLRTFKKYFRADYLRIKKQLSSWKIKTDLSIQLKTIGFLNKENKSIKSFVDISTYWKKNKDILKTYYLLLIWILKFKEESNGKGIPFDLAYLDFYKRLMIGKNFIDKIFQNSNEREQKKYKSFNTIINRLEGKDKKHRDFYSSINKLNFLNKWFLKLRGTLYLTNIADNEDKISPLSKRYNLSSSEVQSIPNNIDDFISEIDNTILKYKNKSKKEQLIKVKKQTLKYKNNLNIPIFKNPNNSKLPLIPYRTNNCLEQLFRFNKQIIRRITGRKELTREFGAIGDLLPYYKNMKEQKLFKAIFSSEKRLVEEFSKIKKPLTPNSDNIIPIPNPVDFNSIENLITQNSPIFLNSKIINPT